MKTHFFKIGLYLFASIILISCNKQNKESDDSSSIKSITLIDTVKVDLIKQSYDYFLRTVKQLSDAEIEQELAKVKYDVIFSKVTYDAIDPFGRTKTLSGLVAYPILPTDEKEKELSIISIQHGTLSYESHAPSLSQFKDPSLNKNALNYAAAFKNGYILLMPDYFGYGSDEKGLHYYEVASSLAEATRKLIEAAPSFAKQKSISLNLNKLFLFGYSEGGFATMSTLKSLSENPSIYTDITTVAGAGAYDKLATARQIIQQQSGESTLFTASYIWVLLTYNKIYDINRPLDELLQSKTAPEVKKYVDTDNIMQIRNIPPAPSEAFSPSFVEGIINNSDKAFVDALTSNNVSNFTAKGYVDLVHGSSDTWVPTFNTDSAYVHLQKRGLNVHKYIFEGGTHSTTYPVFVIKALEKL